MYISMTTMQLYKKEYIDSDSKMMKYKRKYGFHIWKDLKNFKNFKYLQTRKTLNYLFIRCLMSVKQ